LEGIGWYREIIPVKSEQAPYLWFDLAEHGLLNESVIQSLNNYGHVRQEEMVFKWFTKDWNFIKD
jgi:hypothetical protein